MYQGRLEVLIGVEEAALAIQQEWYQERFDGVKTEYRYVEQSDLNRKRNIQRDRFENAKKVRAVTCRASCGGGGLEMFGVVLGAETA